jgi:hypothetical protein
MAAKKAPPKRGYRRAGAVKRYSEKRDDLFREVLEMMTSGKFKTGVTIYELTERYGYALDYVKRVTGEVSRYIRLAYQDREETAAKMQATLDHGVRLALGAKEHAFDQKKGRWHSVDAPNLKALKDLIRLQAEILGRANGSQNNASNSVVNVQVEELKPLLATLGYQLMPVPQTLSEAEANAAQEANVPSPTAEPGTDTPESD